MKEILYLEPVFKEMIWGGQRLREEFGYDIPSGHTGECWAVSAHPAGDLKISHGRYKDCRLSWLWENQRELFGNAEGSVFPLLIKIIDAKEDLSIQVHPDNAYAKEHENGALGKTECWYVLDSARDASIVIGHNASDKEELSRMIREERWNELIRQSPVKPGDFFQITPGTVHAIKAGTLILEIQQSSDITYRLYDYGRLSEGKPRELHIQKSIDVITCPYLESMPRGRSSTLTQAAEITVLVQCEFYTVTKVVLKGGEHFGQTEPFTIISIIDGSGHVDGQPVKKGDHFILSAGYGDYTMNGNMSFLVSHL